MPNSSFSLGVERHILSLREEGDRVFIPFLFALFVVSLGLASWYSTFLEALMIGLPAAALPFVLSKLNPAGHPLTRLSVAISMAIYSALFIHQSHGMIEMHFSVFCLLAFLLYYRDWLAILVSAAVIAVHHILFFFLQAQSVPVFVFPKADSFWIVIIHAVFLILEAALLMVMSIRMLKESKESAAVSFLAQTISEGHLDVKINELHSESELIRSVQTMQNRVHGLVKDIASNANVMHHHSSELIQLAHSVEQGASTQTLASSSIAGRVNDLTSGFHAAAEHANRGATLSTQAAAEAQSSATVVNQTVDAMRTMAGTLQTTSQNIDQLGAQSDRIVGIVNVIREIAEQTNLLALNAAIEAARAGEQGRGFAVVADEVRKLAERTSASTAEIQSMIGDMAQSKEKALASMHALVNQVDETVESVGTAGQSIQEIATSSQEVAGTVEHISALLGEQLAAANAIQHQVEEVAHSAQSTEQEVVRTRQLVTEIEGMSQRLHHAVNAFHVA